MANLSTKSCSNISELEDKLLRIQTVARNTRSCQKVAKQATCGKPYPRLTACRRIFIHGALADSKPDLVPLESKCMEFLGRLQSYNKIRFVADSF